VINPDVIRICCCYFNISEEGGGCSAGQRSRYSDCPRVVSPGFESL